MQWHEDKQVLMTCAKDKNFKIWQFPLVWVDEQDVDLQRAPDAIKSKKKVPASSQVTNSNSAAAQ